jgi:predicted PurR-regulated permease PerM
LSSVNSIFKKHWKFLFFILGLIVVFLLIWIFRGALIPFIIGFILASLMSPIIRWIEARFPKADEKPKIHQLKRIFILVTVYIIFMAIIAFIVFYSFNLIWRMFSTLTQESFQITLNGLETIKEWLYSIPVMENPVFKHQIEASLQKANEVLPNALNSFLTNGVETVQNSARTIFGFLVMPVFVFYILKDWEKLWERFYAGLPTSIQTHTKNIFSILHEVVWRFVRAQLLLGLIVGILVFIMLIILKIEFAIPLAVFAGLMEMVPMIGPWLGCGMIVVVALATAPHNIIWVALGYLIIELLENTLLVPRIQGSQMEIHPAFVILLGFLGAYFAGVLGFIIILPLTLAIKRILKYVQENTIEEKN